MIDVIDTIRSWALRAASWKTALVAVGAIGIVAVEPGEVWRWVFALALGLILLVFWAILGFWTRVFKTMGDRSAAAPDTLEPTKQ
jgi:hypothetical protein